MLAPARPSRMSAAPIYVTYHVNGKRKDVIRHVVANGKAGVPDAWVGSPGLPETGTCGPVPPGVRQA